MNDQPAFPTNNWQKMVPQSTGYSEGMSLRDYFAAKAMLALGSSPKLAVFDDDAIAEGAYKIADAMMKAREK